MKYLSIPAIILAMLALSLPACSKLEEQLKGGELQEGEHASNEHGGAEHAEGEHAGEGHGEEGHGEHQHRILVTTPIIKDVVSTQRYVCQIHSRRHIEVRALEGGYLEEIPVREGQSVKQGDLMFKILPVLYQARLATEVAEAQVAQIEYANALKLFQQNVVSKQELALVEAKLAKAQAKVSLAQAELNFATIKAPFDGIVDKQYQQQGSLIEEGDILSTLSDNSVMWVYFNVPEARYLAYQADPHKNELKVELMLANGVMFPQVGKIGAIEADFNNENGNIAFRADFDNPDFLLRNGQTGTIVLSRVMKDALVIPQRATYEILAKKYCYVIDKDNVVHQRDIVIQSELDDIYVIKEGLKAGEKIILEGIRQVRDGEKIEYEFEAPEKVLSHLKYHAE